MSEIPTELMDEAFRVFAYKKLGPDALIMAIARALDARDKRAAEIARNKFTEESVRKNSKGRPYSPETDFVVGTDDVLNRCHVCGNIAPHADAALCIRCDSEVGARVHYDPDRGWYAGFPADRREGCWHCAGARLSRDSDGVLDGVKFVIAPCRVCGRLPTIKSE